MAPSHLPFSLALKFSMAVAQFAHSWCLNGFMQRLSEQFRLTAPIGALKMRMLLIPLSLPSTAHQMIPGRGKITYRTFRTTGENRKVVHFPKQRN